MLTQKTVEDAFKRGRKRGYDEGLVAGINAAYPDGFQRFGSQKEAWRQSGYDDGYAVGYKKGGDEC